MLEAKFPPPRPAVDEAIAITRAASTVASRAR